LQRGVRHGAQREPSQASVDRSYLVLQAAHAILADDPRPPREPPAGVPGENRVDGSSI
jgi:hypothetical protein